MENNEKGPQDGENRTFRLTVDDIAFESGNPLLTGTQILLMAGKHPVDEYLVYWLTPEGLLEDIGLEEPVDLRQPGTERFLTFLSDRSFRFELDGVRQDWGLPKISEPTLRKLAGVGADYRVWLERRGQEDLKLAAGAMADLGGEGIERFYTGREDTKAGCTSAVLPQADRRYVSEHELVTEDLAQGAQKGIVFKNYPLPLGRFNVEAADLLVVLPPGYPDAVPDMFFADPWLRLAGTAAYPNCADQPFAFGGRTWQRWSRHNTAWRPGKDGIQTMLRRIDNALRGDQ